MRSAVPSAARMIAAAPSLVGGHAARAELALDGVAVGEGSFEAVKGVWHQGLRWGVRAQAASGPHQVMRYLTRA